MVLIAVSVDRAPYAQNMLSDARLQKAFALKSKDDQARSLCAGLALDAALRTVGLCERDVTIETDDNGKPFLANHPEWHFSLSHSGDFAVCALDDAPIGVDIEQIRTIDAARLAKRVFGITDPITPEAVFALWTKRESYLKAIGVGLNGLHTEPDDRWHFQIYSLAGYSLTVCSPKNVFIPTLSFFSCDDSDLLR